MTLLATVICRHPDPLLQAKDLILKLMCAPKDRLDFAGIQVLRGRGGEGSM